MSKKLLTIVVLLNTSILLCQTINSVKVDGLKSVLGIYQIELEHFKDDKWSYGLGFTFVDTSLRLFAKDETNSFDGFSISPFVRYYKNNNKSNSAFYQSNLRYFSVDLESDGKPREKMISLDINYGYQIKLYKKLFLETTIGIGAMYFLEGSETYKGDFIPYPMLNLNITYKI